MSEILEQLLRIAYETEITDVSEAKEVILRLADTSAEEIIESVPGLTTEKYDFVEEVNQLYPGAMKELKFGELMLLIVNRKKEYQRYFGKRKQEIDFLVCQIFLKLLVEGGGNGRHAVLQRFLQIPAETYVKAWGELLCGTRKECMDIKMQKLQTLLWEDPWYREKAMSTMKKLLDYLRGRFYDCARMQEAEQAKRVISDMLFVPMRLLLEQTTGKTTESQIRELCARYSIDAPPFDEDDFWYDD